MLLTIFSERNVIKRINATLKAILSVDLELPFFLDYALKQAVRRPF